MARKPKDLTGQRFGHWKVVSYAGIRACGKTNRHYASWVCLCDCRTARIILAQQLTSGKTLSCGCSRRDGTRYPSGRRGGANYHGPEKDFTIPAARGARETDYVPSDYGKDDAWMLGTKGLKGLFSERQDGHEAR